MLNERSDMKYLKQTLSYYLLEMLCPLSFKKIRSQGFRITMLFLLFSFASTQTYWVKYGWQAFNSAGDARILSLGGAAVTDFGTSVSPLFNPAASSRVGIHNINYTHQSRLAGMINSDLIGFPIRILSKNHCQRVHSPPACAGRYQFLMDFGLDGIPGTGDIGEGNGILDEGERLDESKLKYFSQRQLGLHLSTAWKTENFEIGLALKMLQHSLGEFSGTGMGLDLGILMIPWDNGRLGLTIRDVTTSWQVWDNGTVERFKPTIITGIAHTYQSAQWPIAITGMGNIMMNTSGRSLEDDFNVGKNGGQLLLGINVVYSHQIAVRLGRNAIGSTTAGMGLSWENLSLDYAYLNAPSGSGLGSTHMVSLSVNSDWVRKQIEKL